MTSLFADSSLVFPWQLIDKGDWLKLGDFQMIIQPFYNTYKQCYFFPLRSVGQ